MEKPLIYFDNAATSWPKPESVYKFMDEFYRSHGINPARGGVRPGHGNRVAARPHAQNG